MDEKLLEVGKEVTIHGSNETHIIIDSLVGKKQNYYLLSRSTERGQAQMFIPAEMVKAVEPKKEATT